MTSAGPDDFARDEDARPGSERSFGLVMAGFFTLVAVIKLWHVAPLWWTWFAVALVFAAAAWLHPALLRPLNYVWFRFGLLLHRIVSPVVMALMFFGAVLPTGLMMRLFGNRPLRDQFEPEAETYWIARQDGTPAPGSMKNQY